MRIAEILLLAAFLSGCTTSYNVATKQQESYLFRTDKEIQMGISVSRKLEEQYPPVRDPELLDRINRIGQRIVAVSERKDLTYRFGILDMKEPNALALPGGIIYVTTGLLDILETDDELASVLGHEVGHVSAKHILKRLQSSIGLQALQALAIVAGPRDRRSQASLNLAVASVLTAYSQEDELEADRLGTKYLKRAGYDPLAAISFLTRLRDHSFQEPSRRFSYFRTHPFFGDRIRTVRAEATGRIEFDDYINARQ